MPGLTAYDGTKLALPLSSSSSQATSAPASVASGEDGLRQLLLKQISADPAGVPDSIKQLVQGHLNPRQQLQKQLNSLRKTETKLKKKKEVLLTKTSSWENWKAGIRALVIQETDRFEEEVKEIQNEIESLTQEMLAEQERLNQLHQCDVELPEEMEQEEDLAAWLDALRPASESKVPAPEPTSVTPSIVGNSHLVRQEGTPLPAVATCAPAIDPPTVNPVDFQAQMLRQMNADPEWLSKHGAAFMQMMSVAQLPQPSLGDQRINLTNGVNSYKASPSGTKNPMQPFGRGARAHPYSPPGIPKEAKPDHATPTTVELQEGALYVEDEAEKEEKADTSVNSLS